MLWIPTAARKALTSRQSLRRTGNSAAQRALRSPSLTVTLDIGVRQMTRGDQQSVMFTRDAAIADTVEWIVRREDRIVLAAHNGHLQRWPRQHRRTSITDTTQARHSWPGAVGP